MLMEEAFPDFNYQLGEFTAFTHTIFIIHIVYISTTWTNNPKISILHVIILSSLF